jgi:hypothetical protein
MLTTDHGAVLRAKCLNGKLYRSDAKLSTWLGIGPEEVQGVLDRLVAQGVLSLVGISSRGSELYHLQLVADGPSSAPVAEGSSFGSLLRAVDADGPQDPWNDPSWGDYNAVVHVDSGDPRDPFSTAFIPRA